LSDRAIWPLPSGFPNAKVVGMAVFGVKDWLVSCKGCSRM
jgi:hypothetical protein